MKFTDEKSTFILLLLFFSLIQPIVAQDKDTLICEACEAYKLRQFSKCAVLFEIAINSGARSPEIFYNASCFAISGRKEKALYYLEKAVLEGFSQADHMQNDF